MPRSRSKWLLLPALALASVCCGVLAPASQAGTREPLSVALAAGSGSQPPVAYDSTARPDRTAALRAMTQRSARRYENAADEFQISSTYYSGAAVESVADTLRSLDHGPEMAELSVYVATPQEISEICGATVLACYIPSTKEMVVSGEDHPVDGVPRAFAIAHEYGHHIANSRSGSGPYPPIEAGTIRWATYERVCQLTRRHRLFPGNQGAHYWEDPEEAFAQSYAHLSLPEDHVSWQYTPLLAPTMASLTKIHADIARPWRGPVTDDWSGSLAAAPAAPARRQRSVRRGGLGIGAAHSVGSLPWVAARRVRTPLDGTVSVALQAAEGDSYSVTLRDPKSGRALSRAVSGEGGSADLSYSNCGHAALMLEVRSTGPAGSFQASVSRP